MVVTDESGRVICMGGRVLPKMKTFMIQNQPFAIIMLLEYETGDLLIFIGFLLSECRLIPQLTTPPDPLISCYSIICTGVLLFLLLSEIYAFKGGIVIEWCQYVLYPLQAMGAATLYPSLLPLACLAIQAGLLLIKIRLLNAVQMNQISKSLRLFRVIKVVVITAVTVSKIEILPGLLILLVTNLLNLQIFFTIFTFQRCRHQYIVAAALSAGFLSLLEYYLDYSYLYLGEILCLCLALKPRTPLHHILFRKYVYYAKKCLTVTTKPYLLGVTCFLEEAIFTQKRSVRWSREEINEAIAIFVLLSGSEGVESKVAWKLYLETYLRPSSSPPIYEYYIRNCLLHDANKALLVFYEKGSSRTPSSRLLYGDIVRRLSKGTHIRNQFVEFSQMTEGVSELMIQFCGEETAAMEYLIENESVKEAEILRRLTLRHTTKSKIDRKFAQCLVTPYYSTSTRFKYLYFMYANCICNRSYTLLSEINRLFLLGAHQELLPPHSSLCVAVISSQGELLNTNEPFRTQFKINWLSKMYIRDFLPTPAQKKAHLNHFKAVNQPEHLKRDHSSLKCYVQVQKRGIGGRIKCLEECLISTRVYYQISTGLQYLACMELQPSSLWLIEERRYREASSAEANFIVINTVSITQLGDQMKVYEVLPQEQYEDIQSLSSDISIQSLSDSTAKFRAKMAIIEEKITTRKKRSARSWIELVWMAFITTAMLVGFNITSTRISLYRQFLTGEKQVVLRGQEIPHRYAILRGMLNIILQNNSISSDYCYNFGINNLTELVIEQSVKYIHTDSNAFEMQALNGGIPSANMDSPINNRLFHSILTRYSPQPISLAKDLALFKSVVFSLISLSPAEMGAAIEAEKSEYLINQLPELLLLQDILSPGSIYGQLTAKSQDYKVESQWVSQIMRNVLVVSCIVLLGLYVRGAYVDTVPTLHLLESVLSIPLSTFLIRRQEMKLLTSKLNNLQNYKVKSADISHRYELIVTDHSNICTSIPIGRLATREDRTIMSQSALQDPTQASKHQEQASTTQKFLKLKWKYLLIGLTGVILLSLSASLLHSANVNALNQIALQANANHDLMALEHFIIDEVTLLWLQISTPIPFSNSFSKLMNRTVTILSSMNFTDNLITAYGDVGVNIALGNVCQYLNSSICSSYRDNILSSGLNVVISHILKDLREMKDVSSGSELAGDVCGKTALLFHILSPLLAQIAIELVQASSDLLEILCATTCLVVMTILACISVYAKWLSPEQIHTKAELLSLDRVDQLYTCEQVAPYLNAAYYP